MIEDEGFKKIDESWSPIGWTVIGDLGFEAIGSYCYLANPDSWLVEFKIGIRGRYIFIDTISDLIDVEDILEIVKEEMSIYELQNKILDELEKTDLYPKNINWYDADTLSDTGICTSKGTGRAIQGHEKYSGVITSTNPNWNYKIDVQGNASTTIYS